jgi:tetratricopeptide (TPR) repeat protein
MTRFALIGLILLIFLEGVSAAAPQETSTVPKENTLKQVQSDALKQVQGLIAEGKTAEAKRILQEFRRKNPDNPLAIFYLARVEKDRNLARALLKEVERLAGPDLASEAAYMRAEMLYAEGGLSGAEEIFVKIVSEHPSGPNYSDALYRLGMIRLSRGDPDDALLRFRRCRDTETDPFKKTLARVGIMECHLARRDWNRVLVAAREVLEGRDDASALTPRVLEVIALAWRELGNDDNAEKFTRRILTDFPRSYQAHALREQSTGSADMPSSSFSSKKASSDSAGSRSRFFGEPETGSSRKGAADGDTGRVSSKVEGALDENVEYSVQAAAYEVRLNALKLYNLLKGAGFSARIEMKTAGDKYRYLVRVGVYKTRKEAEDMVNRMERETGVRGGVIILR